MTRKLQHAVSLFTIIFFIVLGLASATGKNLTVSKESGEIPPNFDPTRDTLLVLKNTIRAVGLGNTFKSAFKNYKYPYLIIDEDDLKSYDKNKYNFVLYLSHNPSNNTTSRDTPGPGTISCIIKDRTADKIFKSVGVPDYGRLLKNYVESLNRLTK